jgi:hypothetical protein
VDARHGPVGGPADRHHVTRRASTLLALVLIIRIFVITIMLIMLLLLLLLLLLLPIITITLLSKKGSISIILSLPGLEEAVEVVEVVLGRPVAVPGRHRDRLEERFNT